MAKRCLPNRTCGMSQGIFNPFFQNGSQWYGSGGSTPVLLISGASLDILNRYIDVNFNPNVYNSSGGGVLASDFQIIFSQNGGVATACSISSVTNTSGGALVGGEGTVRFNLSFTGNPSGVELISVKASAAGVYKDSFGNLNSADDESPTLTVNLEYDPLYKAGLVTALSNSLSIPTLPQRLVHNAWFTGSRTDGTLTEWDFINILDYSTSFARINFINGTLQGTVVNSPTTTLFKGTRGVRSSSSYIRTGWIPSSHASKFTTIYNSIMVLVYNNAQDDGYLTGGRGATNTGHNAIRARTTGNVAGCVVNANTVGLAKTVSSITDSEGTFMVTRRNPPDANTVTKMWIRGVEQTPDGTNNTSALSSREMYICAKNDDGSPSVIDENHDIMIVAYGSGLQATKASEIHTRNEAYRTAMIGLLPTLSGRLYAVIGQSNADYSNGVLADLTAPQAALYNNGPISIANGYDANVYIWWDDEWQLLEAGVNGVQRGAEYFGPIYPFAVAEAAKYPGEDLFIVKETIGGSGMYTSGGLNNWLPDGLSSTRYETFISKYNAARAAMSSVTAYMPVWWFQGEQDALVEQQSIDYGPAGLNNESIMMTAIRAETNFDDFIVSQIFPGQPGFAANVRSAKTSNYGAGLYGTLGALKNADDLGTIGHLSITNCITNAQRVSTAYP